MPREYSLKSGAKISAESTIEPSMSPKTKSLLRDFFYCYIPLWSWLLPLVSRIVPTFLPIEGYLKFFRPTRGSVVVDAGAYPGNFAVLLSRLVGSNGKVIALEPDPNNFCLLRSRIEHLKLSNVICLQVALSSKVGSSPFYSTGDEGARLLPDPIDAGLRSVGTVTLDSLQSEYGPERIRYVKMDIEGFEVEALQGATEMLRGSSAKFAIASYHVRNGVRTSDVISDILQKAGYDVWEGFEAHLMTYATKRRGC